MPVVGCVMLAASSALGQQARATNAPVQETSVRADDLSLSQAKVDVRPVARDEEIGLRLRDVLVATGWFTAPRVRVTSGVVFLEGEAPSTKLKTWAGELAHNTEGVVAVANRMTVPAPSVWDLGPASRGVATLWRDIVGALPSIVFGVIVLALSFGAAVLTTRGTRRALEHRIRVKLLRTVSARALGVLVFLLGAYVVLRVMGLTQLALTVVGGTGLVGLALGIAFRDITENFLASIFLSVQRPFEPSDLIEAAGVTGYVQQLNMRTTVLMNLDGNVVQIPNATVYKSILRNYSTNCNRREVFDVGIGYDDAISEAQEIARRILADHPAVLDDPEPSVLVDSLGAATVNLRIFFWLNGQESRWLKVRSSVIRLVKREFQLRGISMPDAAREIIFPNGVPVIQHVDATGAPATNTMPAREAVATRAEGGLHSEATVIEEQARQSRKSNDEQDLLTPAVSPASAPSSSAGASAS